MAGIPVGTLVAVIGDDSVFAAGWDGLPCIVFEPTPDELRSWGYSRSSESRTWLRPLATRPDTGDCHAFNVAVEQLRVVGPFPDFTQSDAVDAWLDDEPQREDA